MMQSFVEAANGRLGRRWDKHPANVTSGGKRARLDAAIPDVYRGREMMLVRRVEFGHREGLGMVIVVIVVVVVVRWRMQQQIIGR